MPSLNWVQMSKQAGILFSSSHIHWASSHQVKVKGGHKLWLWLIMYAAVCGPCHPVMSWNSRSLKWSRFVMIMLSLYTRSYYLTLSDTICYLILSNMIWYYNILYMLKALTVLTFWGACCSQKVTLWSVDLRPPAHFEGTLLILRPWITAIKLGTKWNKMENKLNKSIQKVQPGHTSNCFPSLQNWAHGHTSNGHLFNRLPCLGNNVVKLCFVQRLFDKCCCPAKSHQKS